MVGKLTRNDTMSASRIPVLLNASPYQTRNELLADFRNIDKGGEPNWIPQNEPMFWGDTLEDTILRVAGERLNLKDVRTSFASAFEHPTLPLAASLDGAATGSGVVAADETNGIYTPQGEPIDLTGEVLLEAKNTGSMPENPPAAHRGPLQLQAQMMCTGIKKGIIAVLYRGNELRLFLYKADPVIQQRIVTELQDFEERRKTGEVYPLADTSDGVVAYPRGGLDRLYFEDMTNESLLVDMLVGAIEQKKNAEEDIEQMTAGLMEGLGEASECEVMVGNRTYLVKWPSRTYKAQPERVVPAKPERTVRSKTLVVKEID